MEEMVCIHFVGFRDSMQFDRAVRVFGPPDFVHRYWDMRAKNGGERGPHDVVVFAIGTDADDPRVYAYDDSAFR